MELISYDKKELNGALNLSFLTAYFKMT